MRPRLFYKISFCLIAFALWGSATLQAQTIEAPVPIPNQTPPAGSSPWPRACASDSFNDFWVNITWGLPLVNSDNEFILELSDANGSFSSPVELARIDDQNTNFDFNVNFALPTDTRGENYKMRVRGTSPAVTGAESIGYAMYFIDFDTPLLMGRQGDNAIPSGGVIEVCDGTPLTIEPFNIPNADTYQYNWYRSGTLLTEKSNLLQVTQAGMYSVEVDYGSCSGSGNTLSNIVEVTFGSSLGVAINPPTRTALCSGDNEDLIANIMGQGLTYIWYKDGTAITSPTVDDHIYTVDASIPGFEGDYQVEISGAGVCVERSTAVTITNAGDFTVTRDNAANIVLIPTQPVTLSVTTTAAPAAYQWYMNGAPISGETNSTLNVTQAGVYFARVSMTGGACSATTVDSEVTTVVTPASFELAIDYIQPYSACQSTSVVLEVVSINAVATDGTRADVTSQLQSQFTYVWEKDGVTVPSATNSSLSLVNNAENGNYMLIGTLDSFNPVSNQLPVQLASQAINITSTSNVFCNSADDIIISTTTDLTGETFEWTRNGTSINTTESSITVNQEGLYQLVLTADGCTIPSNEINIAPLDSSLITFDTSDNVVFPEGTSTTVTASGGTTYQWLDAANNVLSDTASVTIDQEGTYMLVATIGNCSVTRQLTAEFLDTFRIPNVISANGDGINDQWVIPNTYSNNQEVNVIIYNDQGEELVNDFGYQNNWPSSSTAFPRQNMIFYYTIRNDQEILRRGTITVIR